MIPFTRLLRRVRFGRPIIIVSGLPRSGTSMMMKMLDAGGLPLLTDGLRTPDESNPEGYFELEAVKDLDKVGKVGKAGTDADSATGTGADISWLAAARGRGVKVLTPLLAHLPETYNYRVIFMQRPLSEVISSQNKMLARAGEATDVVPQADVAAQYEAHLRRVHTLLARRSCFETLFVPYGDVIAAPAAQAARIINFVGGALAADRTAPGRMAAAVNERLYRNRSEPGATP
jgi:hypothetical protein